MVRPRGNLTWRPSAADFTRVLTDQNPWHASGRVPEALACPIERGLAGVLWRAVDRTTPRQFQLVLGPRRAGKTTVMLQTVRHLLARGVPARRLWWLQLDHPLLMQVPLGTLVKSALAHADATADLPLYLFLDELTYAPDWDLWLRISFDEQWPVRIVATSSFSSAPGQRQLQSAPGRWEEQHLSPCLFDEYLDLAGVPLELEVEETLGATLRALAQAGGARPDLVPHRQTFLLTGGFPELVLGASAAVDEASRLLHSQRVLRAAALERSLYKDIPRACGVEDPLMLERLLHVLGGQVTGVLSPSALCSELCGAPQTTFERYRSYLEQTFGVDDPQMQERLLLTLGGQVTGAASQGAMTSGFGGMSQPTFDRYLAHLERAFLVFTLPNYSGNEGTVQRRGRKLYFVDGAVRNAALQRGLAPLTDPGEMALLLENAAASHLHALSQQARVRLYHWRDQRDEVDLVYDDPNGPLAFEIGSSPQHARRGLLTFAQRFPRFSGGLWMVAPHLPTRAPGAEGDPVGTISLELFLATVGRQARAMMHRRLLP